MFLRVGGGSGRMSGFAIQPFRQRFGVAVSEKRDFLSLKPFF